MSNARICIDGFNLSLPKGSGIATYARNLSQAIRGLGYRSHVLWGPRTAVGRNRLLNEVSLRDAPSAAEEGLADRILTPLLSPLGRAAANVQQSGEVMPAGGGAGSFDEIWACRDVFHAANRGYAWTKRFTPVRIGEARSRPDIMHWTCPLPLRAVGMPNLYTIHDLVPLRLPFATLDNKSRFYSMCKAICDRADHIVTVSETSRRDIIRIFGVREDQISNTYQAVDLPRALVSQRDEEVATDIAALFGLDWRRYFLFFGAVEPKKNLGRVIEAYLASGVSDPLIIVGGAGWLGENETRMLYDDLVTARVFDGNVVRRADRIRRYDHLPLASLVSLIRGAKATVFPSLYEGFGLPVLESMMLGTPVLTSTAGSLPEVAGEAALLVDPYDVHAIKRAIRALDADEGLRRELAAKGHKQSSKFSAQAWKGRMGEVYNRLL